MIIKWIYKSIIFNRVKNQLFLFISLYNVWSDNLVADCVRQLTDVQLCRT